MHLIVSLIIGGIAGWLAGKFMSGHGYGPIVDIILGLVGGLVFGWIVSTVFGLHGGGHIFTFIVSFIGACILVAILHLVRREPVRT